MAFLRRIAAIVTLSLWGVALVAPSRAGATTLKTLYTFPR
jgi:hypothetical protein